MVLKVKKKVMMKNTTLQFSQDSEYSAKEAISCEIPSGLWFYM